MDKARRPTPDEIDLVITHADCFDGFTAAWCAWLRLGDNAEYHHMLHHHTPPIVGGRKVAVLDFSWKRPVMEQLAEQADALIVLDHHEGAEEDLAGLPFAVFDMKRSGAKMSWDFFHGEDTNIVDRTYGEAAQLVEYVMDRDLWTWKLPESKAINEALKIVPFDFHQWSYFAGMLSRRRDLVVTEGKALLKLAEQHLNLLARSARVETIAGHRAWVACAPYIYASELGNLLANRGDPDIAAVWRYDHVKERIDFSLRASATSTVNVRKEISDKFGGGGHAKAAGFGIPAKPNWLDGLR